MNNMLFTLCLLFLAAFPSLAMENVKAEAAEPPKTALKEDFQPCPLKLERTTNVLQYLRQMKWIDAKDVRNCALVSKLFCHASRRVDTLELGNLKTFTVRAIKESSSFALYSKNGFSYDLGDNGSDDKVLFSVIESYSEESGLEMHSLLMCTYFMRGKFLAKRDVFSEKEDQDNISLFLPYVNLCRFLHKLELPDANDFMLLQIQGGCANLSSLSLVGGGKERESQITPKAFRGWLALTSLKLKGIPETSELFTEEGCFPNLEILTLGGPKRKRDVNNELKKSICHLDKSAPNLSVLKFIANDPNFPLHLVDILGEQVQGFLQPCSKEVSVLYAPQLLIMGIYECHKDPKETFWPRLQFKQKDNVPKEYGDVIDCVEFDKHCNLHEIEAYCIEKIDLD